MVSSKRLKADARAHQAQNPGTSYREALRAVSAPAPLLDTAGDPVLTPPPTVPPVALDDGYRHIPDFFEALGIEDIDTHDFRAVWERNAASGSLRIPHGYVRDGDLITPELSYLDFLEESLGGNGPHGAVAGRTGSGKSYFLRSIVLSLAALYSPEDVSLILGDFKGGATFLGMDKLPHTVASISNLENTIELVDRLGGVISGEVSRREEFLTSDKGCKDIYEYHQKRREHPDSHEWPALPHLIIIIDEFGELLRERPGYFETLIRVARVGRSLGIHLLMSSQFIDKTVAGDLFDHLSFRFALSLNSPMHSISMIGSDDAATMIGGTVKGKVLRKYGTDPLPVEVVGFHHEAPLIVSGQVGAPQTSMANALIDRLSKLDAPRPTAMWTSSLRVPRSLPSAPKLNKETKGMRIRIGVLDAPEHHTTLPWYLDFGGQRPHYVIAGGPKSGRSTTLRTMVISGALTHGPQRLAFMLLDGDDAALAAVSGAPNVAAHIRAGDSAGIDAILEEVDRLIDLRTEMMAAAGHGDFDQYLAAKSSDSDDPYGYIIVAIDSIGTFLGDNRADQASKLHRIIESGHRVGVHLVFTADSSSAYSTGNTPHYTIELPESVQLPSSDYSGARMPAEVRITLPDRIPSDQPGRSFDVTTMLQARVMLPINREITADAMRRGMAVYNVHDYTGEVRALAEQIAHAYADEKVPVTTPDMVSAVQLARRRKAIASLRTEIDAIIGQSSVKEQLHALVSAAQVESELRRRGLNPPASAPRHIILDGAPGIGKSHVAELIGRILHAAGQIRTSRVTVSNRPQFIGTVEGETSAKTKALIDKARGGVLYIDDACDLVQNRGGSFDPFGTEALRVLMQALSDSQVDLAVIIGGFAAPMRRLLDENPGLASYFGTRISFDPFTAAELWQHLLGFAERDGRVIDPDAEKPFIAAAEALDAVNSHGHRVIDMAGNIRFVRNVYEVAQHSGAQRLSRVEDLSALTDEDLLRVTAEDIAAAARRVVKGFGVELPETD
ncbi:FtsK/SpoIIIE domain-containing protein [Mycolicibacterium conceptionense]|uniref:FtsK/SpoIIIE domain-containing protein n=1 Tax=Mycolicibacterium conceptionense TaxID=451644 RepID=UPI00069F24C5|nr:FtsK/SpoIIIE domain-containing protein [Mycolicibacterium conceptionense]